MCGWAGALVLSSRDCGPDGAGTWIASDEHVGLADQPMSNEDEPLWIVCKGEIHNHVKIRAELNHLGGFQWKTETILHAVQQWVIYCLQCFNGMFTLQDARPLELRLAPDRIGTKPLRYGVHNGRGTFASEIKALLKHPGQSRGVNEKVVTVFSRIASCPNHVRRHQQGTRIWPLRGQRPSNARVRSPL